MTRTHTPKSANTTYHRDGSVTVWNCLQSAWMRGTDPSDELLATLGREERYRVVAHVAGIGTQWTNVYTRPYIPVTDDDGMAAGNVTIIQRRRRGGCIQERRIAANGRHTATGETFDISLCEALA